MPRVKPKGRVVGPLKKWMKLATAREQADLAKRARTSREYLYQLSNGVREASPEIAGRIETAAEKIRQKSDGRLPGITRAELSPVCGGCPYAKKCLGSGHDRKDSKTVGKKKNS